MLAWVHDPDLGTAREYFGGTVPESGRATSPGVEMLASWKPGTGRRHPDMNMASCGQLPISGSELKSMTLLMWKKISKVMSLTQMGLGVLLTLAALAFVQHSTKTVLVVSGIVMAKLGSLGFFGANKLAPRALLIQMAGSVGVVFLIFGGVNQVARNVEVDCAFGEVFVRVFHMEERLQAVKHDEMVSSLFLRLNQMDDMLYTVKDGALEDLTMRTRVNEILEQDKNLIRTKLQKMHGHARDVLAQLREESLNSTMDSRSVSADTKQRIRENVEQRILSAQFALERIEKHLASHDDLSSQEYELLLEALTHGTTHDGLREEIASYKNDSDEMKDALTRHRTGVIEDPQAHRAAAELQKIRAHREETKKQFENFFNNTLASHEGITDGYRETLSNTMLKTLPGHCLSEGQSFFLVRALGWGTITLQAGAIYVVSTFLCFVPNKYHLN